MTVLALWLVFRNVDARMLWGIARQQSPALLGVAFASIIVQIILASERWRVILSALTRNSVQPKARFVYAAFYSGAFFNNLPLGNIGGDIAKLWLARKFNLPFGQTVMSILVDHALALFGPILLAALTLLSVKHPLASTLWFAAVGILVGAAVCLYLLRFIENVLGNWRERRFIHIILRLADELHTLAGRRAAYIGLSYALLSSLCSSFAAYWIGASLGMRVTPTTMMAVMSMVTLITVVPISIAGWGVREVSVVAILGTLGVDQGHALLLSIEFGVLSMFASLPGGLIWVVLRDSSIVPK